MTKEFLIIGDIAGQYKTLMALIEKANKPDATLVSCGDMVDRGRDSDRVVDFFMENGLAIQGNHESMMLDVITHKFKYQEKYRWDPWQGNGGVATIFSYYIRNVKLMCDFINDPATPEERAANAVKNKNLVDKDHVKWLKSLPLFIEHEDENGKLIITHAPINPVYGFEKLKKVNPIEEHSLCWNRGTPRDIPGALQVFGHESLSGVKYFNDSEKPFAVCIDTCRAKVLTALHWPSMEIIQQEYIDG